MRKVTFQGGRMSAGQTGQTTGQMGHVHGTDGTQTRSCPTKNSLCLLVFSFPNNERFSDDLSLTVLEINSSSSKANSSSNTILHVMVQQHPYMFLRRFLFLPCPPPSLFWVSPFQSRYRRHTTPSSTPPSYPMPPSRNTQPDEQAGQVKLHLNLCFPKPC